MKTSADRILTTHVGRLQRPDELTDQMDADPLVRPSDDGFNALLRESVTEIVQQQADAGVDIPTDGEFGKLNWVVYLRNRVAGFEPKTDGPLADNPVGYEAELFSDYYDVFERPGENKRSYFKNPGGYKQAVIPYVCTGPISFKGHDDLQVDIDNLKQAAAASGAEEAFMPSTAPGSVLWAWKNEYYDSEEEYRIAFADALNEEYKAIVDAGLVLQLDDPMLAQFWNLMLPDVDIAEYHRICEEEIELVNYALRDIPADRVRVHICWGSWHGPHVTDVPLENLLPVLGKMNVGGYAFEAGNVRHEHEWRLWKDSGLPDDRILIPGVVSHVTSTVEHPQLVADRLEHFVDAVGKERVIAGTDCGLGFRVHPEIAFAKLRSLAEGAALVR